VQYVNPAAAALWQRAPADLVGRTHSELFPLEAARRHDEVVSRVLASGQAVRREVELVFPFGNQWADVRLVPLFGEGGAVSSVVGVCRDLTERKQAEQQLAEALELNQKMIAASAVGIAAYKASGACVFANEALARMVGGSVPALRDSDFHHAEAWQHSGLSRLADEALGQKGTRSGEFYMTTRFGKTVWLDCHLAPFTSNGEPHLLLLVLDITERKQTEAALSQAERLQRAILDNIPDPAWLKGLEGRFLACNQAMARFYGRPVEAIVGRTAFDCIPREAVRITQEDKMIISTGRTIAVEAPVTDALGRVRWMESIKAPLLDEHEEVIGVTGIARDLTERHELQRQILEISDREQARIGQDIHDELCQQLVSLAFDANSLRRELGARRSAKASKAQRIAEGLDRAITEARRLSRGLFPVRLEREGLEPALEELAKATAARFKIRCGFSRKGEVVVEDPAVATHLYRIAQEAVNNAVRHSLARRVVIRLRGRAGEIDLTIADNGKGLAKTVGRTTTGMGLHIMDYRARTIGGTLHIGPGRRGGMVVSCCIQPARH
jgi:PAS domain S-box-containing protein